MARLSCTILLMSLNCLKTWRLKHRYVLALFFTSHSVSLCNCRRKEIISTKRKAQKRPSTLALPKELAQIAGQFVQKFSSRFFKLLPLCFKATPPPQQTLFNLKTGKCESEYGHHPNSVHAYLRLICLSMCAFIFLMRVLRRSPNCLMPIRQKMPIKLVRMTYSRTDWPPVAFTAVFKRCGRVFTVSPLFCEFFRQRRLCKGKKRKVEIKF